MSAEATGVAGLAPRYATALFELARDSGALDRVDGDLTRLGAMIAESAELRRLIRSPVISRAAQTRAIEAVLEKAELDPLVRRFVGVVAQNRRLFALESIISAFHADLARHRGEITAVVSTAQPLSDAQVSALDSALRRAVGSKVSIETKLEPELLGGLVVKVGSRMFDSSLRAKLQRLQLAMKGAG